MPALPNPRQERFAQNLVNGMKQHEAYTEAGYSPSPGNASVLAKTPSIRERIMELQEEHEQQKGITDPIPNVQVTADGKLTEKSINVTEEWLVRQLQNNIQNAQIAGKYREANAAIEMLGNYFGGLFDKKNPVDQSKKNDKPGSTDNKKDDKADFLDRMTKAFSEPGEKES